MLKKHSFSLFVPILLHGNMNNTLTDGIEQCSCLLLNGKKESRKSQPRKRIATLEDAQNLTILLKPYFTRNFFIRSYISLNNLIELKCLFN